MGGKVRKGNGNREWERESKGQVNTKEEERQRSTRQEESVRVEWERLKGDVKGKRNGLVEGEKGDGSFFSQEECEKGESDQDEAET